MVSVIYEGGVHLETHVAYVLMLMTQKDAIGIMYFFYIYNFWPSARSDVYSMRTRKSASHQTTPRPAQRKPKKLPDPLLEGG